MTRAGILFAPLILVSASAMAWTTVTNEQIPIAAKRGNYALQLPANWLYDLSGSTVLASHDGVALGQINVQLIPHKDAFKAIKRSSSPDMPNEDLAEAYLANLQADGKLADFQIISSDPAEVAGRAGFRVHIRFRLPPAAGDTLMDCTAVGTALPDGLLIAFYKAPRIHFYDKWLPAFDHAVSTLTVSTPSKKS